jgi:hypothetical protein
MLRPSGPQFPEVIRQSFKSRINQLAVGLRLWLIRPAGLYQIDRQAVCRITLRANPTYRNPDRRYTKYR